jgi:protein gp37
MADKSGIQWTEATWNPIVGCSVVSPGCTNCYAMKQAARIERMGTAEHYKGLTKLTKGGPVWTGEVRLVEHLIDQPLRWRRPRMIFVNSMSDLFHESVPEEWIKSIFDVMGKAHRHTFQVLTKRSKRMREILSRTKVFYQNVWLGVSAEDQTRADERIPDLLATPAAVRFVSAEPLLGPIGFRDIEGRLPWMPERHDHFDALHPSQRQRLDWVIVGGESGLGARAFLTEWGQRIVRDCRDTGVACFVKQLGSNPRERGDVIGDTGFQALPLMRLKDRKGGDPNEWPEDLRVRQMPEVKHGH